MAYPVGRKLVDHMLAKDGGHHFITWQPPAPGSKMYKEWKKDHETLYHGRWADQQDHKH